MQLIESHRVAMAQVYGGSRFYLDYLAGRADRYFTHPAGDAAAALRRRQAAAAPGPGLAGVLCDYQRSLGAPEAALAAALALGEADTCCVHTGQQAGFMGGPAYTLYKIVTAIRLAERYEKELGRRCVPVFWLASEDHDLGEINHAHFLAGDGNVGRVRFQWQGAGRSISELPVTDEVREATRQYFERTANARFSAYAADLFAPRGGGFAHSVAAALARLFGGHGLVVLEPHLLRPLFPEFFARAIASAGAVRQELRAAAAALADDGYPVPLDAERAGTLFHTSGGRRVRLADGAAAPPVSELSTDAALRPLLADLALPSLATVLGPGEVAYQAMLRGLYDLFGVPQPLIVGRRSYTLVDAASAAALGHYDLVPEQIVGPAFSVRAAFSAAVPASERARFEAARDRLDELWAPLAAHVASVDPLLARTWRRSLGHARLALDRLEDRTARALMSRRGAARQALQALRGLVWPRGRLQERVLPVAHFVSCYGAALPAALLAACDPSEPDHEILIFDSPPGVPSAAAD